MVLARLLLQWTRADFRNVFCQAVVRITNPLILPLRRVLPPVGKVDTASVVAVLLVATIEVGCLFALHGLGVPPLLVWVRQVLVEIARTLLWTYFYAHLPVRAAVAHRPRRLFAAAVGAHQPVRAGAAADPAPDSGDRGARPVAAVGHHRHPGAHHPDALTVVFLPRARA